MSLFNVLGIARASLVAQQAGIDVTGQNIANASTPGYVRRDPVFSSRPLSGVNGGGVEVSGTSRRMDTFAYARLVDEGGKWGESNARANALAVIEGLIGPATGGIGARMDDLFVSFQELSVAPSDRNVRADVLAKSQSLVEAFSAFWGGLSSAKQELAAQAGATVESANAKLGEVALLNTRIAEAKSLGQEANDLRDRRDSLVRDLGESLGVRTTEDDKGELTLFGAGVALVTGGSASSLDVSIGGDGSLAVRATRPGGSVVDVTANATEGALGGLVRARDQDLPAFANALDALAFDVASQVNAVHALGFGLDGADGRALFELPATSSGAAWAIRVDPAMAGHPEKIGASASASDLPGGSDVAVRLAQLVATPLASGMTPSESWGHMTHDFGTRLASARRESELRSDTVAQAETLHASASGVSLDEETVKLTQFQRAFEASTRVLRTVDELLQGLIRDL